MDIDILCKVVDNFGDIGVVYRLARALSELPERPRLRLIVDGLAAFAALDSAIDAGADRQLAHGWEVFPWTESGTGAGAAAFSTRRSRALLECFACGRPDWLEELLFDPVAGGGCLIVNLEHLTAEAYAEEFHRLPSLTRSPLVRKAVFFPGFTVRTGGLLMDASFRRSRERVRSEAGRRAQRLAILPALEVSGARGEAALGPGDSGLWLDRSALGEAAERFWITVFSYERDYSRIVADLAAFGALAASGEGRPILALVAAGKSSGCFFSAWTAAGEPFPAIRLPFLPQEGWDEILLASDFSIVRGEDSWSRAALSGRPFLWQAYPQEGRHQLVKVRAFIDRLRPHFKAAAPAAPGAEADSPTAAFAALEDLYLAFNDREADSPGERGEERLLGVLSRYSGLLPGFQAFSGSLEEIPDLASSLLTFLREIV